MKRPNLLFIYTDEQAFNTLAAYGNTLIEMPHLNQLAAESFVFDQAYVSQPVCTPSRATLLTGLYPHTTGCTENNVALRPETPCLPELLHDQFATGHFGKWHLGDELFAQHGFDEWISIEDAYNDWFSAGRDRSAVSSYHQFLTSHGFRPQNGDRFSRAEAARLPEVFGKPAFLARNAADFLWRHRHEPFVLYVNFLEPHMPFFGPRDDQYNPDMIPLPENAHDVPRPSAPLKCRLLQQHYARHGHSGISVETEAGWRRLIARYWGLCSLVDTYVGVILRALRESGQYDNTIIVFTSDHGDMMGAHGLIAKCVMYQEAIRVPLMIKLPGQRVGRRVMGPVSQIDLVPTLLELLGQPVAEHLQGRSLCPWFEQPQRPRDEAVFVEWNGPNNGLKETITTGSVPEWMLSMADLERIRAAMTDPVRTVISPDGWKLNYSPLGEHELYHLASDPCERRNVYAEYPGVVRALRGKLEAWQERTGDYVELA